MTDDLDATGLSELVRAGEVHPRELVQQAIGVPAEKDYPSRWRVRSTRLSRGRIDDRRPALRSSHVADHFSARGGATSPAAY